MYTILEKLAKRKMLAASIILRARIIFLAWTRKRNEQFAEELGVGRHSAGRWRKRWQESFEALLSIELNEPRARLEQALVDVLRDARRSGSPGKISAQQKVQLVSIQDHDGAKHLLTGIRYLYFRLLVVFADCAYGRKGLPDWLYLHCRAVLRTVLRPVNLKGFVVLPKRWIVERTFAWINRHRRSSKDYEVLPENSEAVLYIAMIDLMSKRLAKQ